MSLVLYSSSDSEDEQTNERKRFKPQLPSVNIQLENEIDLSEKGPVIETDRTRLFPHERGNWALSIYTYGKQILLLIERETIKFIS